MGRIRALPSGVANHVRASQIIGSVERGVEELIQNAIVHGCARSLSVSMGEHPNNGDFIIVVEDDGVGIDNVSMRTLIGTEACCNDTVTVFGSQGRGDSLRSIAALCTEMKIQSTNGNISSTKVIRNGITVSFEDSTGHGPSSSSILPTIRSIAQNNRTGTRITLRNMFHQFAVRRKYHHCKDLLAAVRATISMLALAYPLVSFKLVNGETGKVDSMIDAPPSEFSRSTPLTCRVLQNDGFSATLEDEVNALVERMNKMNTEESMGRRTIKLTGTDGTDFRGFGVIILFNDETDCSGRKTQLQIAINGRPAAQTKRLVETILDNVKKHFGGNIHIIAGFIHIAAKESELVIKESKAMESVPDLGRMANFVEMMIARAALQSDCNSLRKYSRHSTCPESENKCNNHSRIVKGQYITAEAAAIKKPTQHQSPPQQSSPFANIFFEQSQSPPNRAEAKVKSHVSFDDAFLDEAVEDVMDTSHSYDDNEEAMPSMSWTRNRIQALNSTIAELVPSSGSQARTISFTKEMIASAEVINQVDSSFITIKMGSLICAVDQHAADERISLETLENALFHHDSHDAMVINLTKRQLQVGDILKSSPVIPSRCVQLLSMSQVTTARHYHSLLHKWKFNFEESSSSERTIIVSGLPSVCGRVAQTSDLLEFLNDLGSLAGGSSIKPKFVSRVLASNACRYATMFGDTLSLTQCEKLIKALSKCQLPFVCAHGRPSIIPLIDMSQGSTSEVAANQADNNLAKWGPRRIRR